MNKGPSVTQQKTLAGARRYIEVSRCFLTVLNGEQRGQKYSVDNDVFRIGKSSENHLTLVDDTVSRFHCEVVRDDKGFLLRDLGSTNGTFLDGNEVREAFVTPGAVITVGELQLKVTPHAERIELLPSENASFGELVGGSVMMRELFSVLERISATDATVLLGGETGTGKDVVARSLHAASARAQKPFVVVDCGAVVGTLIESELFGHERGAFTGAVAQRQGAFELGHGGTVFLDEIGELPIDLQPKLLRALEQRSIKRVGGNREIRVDIRVIAASKRDLKMEVERGKFREDLYFRLAVVPIDIPPLCERRDDIPLLVKRLLGQITHAMDPSKPPIEATPRALDMLASHDWPGNVRELRNVLERGAYLAIANGQTEIDTMVLPLLSGETNASMREASIERFFSPGRSYRDIRALWEDDFERRFVTWLLARNHNNISAAAREADMDRKYLHKLAKKHGLHPSESF